MGLATIDPHSEKEHAEVVYHLHGETVGRWFVQMESKIPIWEISVWGDVYHLNKRTNLPKEPRATLTSSK